jgi:hypothetical protein
MIKGRWQSSKLCRYVLAIVLELLINTIQRRFGEKRAIGSSLTTATSDPDIKDCRNNIDKHVVHHIDTKA